MTSSTAPLARDFPALTGQGVTEAHARYCREHGHAVHTLDDVPQPHCPRCGDEREAASVDVSADTMPACDMPDGCGAAAGQPCEPGCPSLATDEANAGSCTCYTGCEEGDDAPHQHADDPCPVHPARPMAADPQVAAPESFRPIYWPSANTPAADRPIVQPLLDAGWTRRAGGQCGDPVPGGGVCRKLGAWGHPVHGEPGRPVCAPHALVRMTLG